MSKLAALLVVGSVLTSASPASADHHHKDWWKYLKGEWTYEITELELKGTTTWRMGAKGNALIGRSTDENGEVGIGISGWQKDTNSVLVNGYGSQGNYWYIKYSKITDNVMGGETHGVLPDGRKYQGDWAFKKIDNDHCAWTFKGKTGDGEALSMTGKYTRKKPDATKKK